MIELQHFQPSEFKLPDQMDSTFLRFLDSVRGRAGVSFVLDSDARSPEHNAQVGGVPTSLHLFDPRDESIKARAVDFTIHDFNQHIAPWTTFAKVSQAVIDVSHEQNISYELEFQISMKPGGNRHIHLGAFRDNTHPSHLVFRTDEDYVP